MANILIVPALTSIYFSKDQEGSNLVPNLTSSASLVYDGGGGLYVKSLAPESVGLERFSVEGNNGKLFSITDTTSQYIFEVNNSSGLPLFTVDNSRTIAHNILSADSIFTNSLSAVSAFINVIDITTYEISGFNINGNAIINGNLTVSGSIYDDAIFINRINNLSNSTRVLDVSGTDYLRIFRDTQILSPTVAGQFASLTARDIVATQSILTPTISTNIVNLSSVIITNDIRTSTSIVTASDQYLRVVINGTNKYLRLFDFT